MNNIHMELKVLMELTLVQLWLTKFMLGLIYTTNKRIPLFRFHIPKYSHTNSEITYYLV